MNTKETRVKNQEKTLERIRVYPWCIPPAEKLKEHILEGEDPSLVHIVLVYKKKFPDEPAGGMLIPISGHQDNLATHQARLEAAAQTLKAESNLSITPFSTAGQEQEGKCPSLYSSSQYFNFAVEGQPKRETHLASLPSLHPELASVFFPREEDHIKETIVLSLEDFQKIVFEPKEREGSYRIVSTSSITEETPASISMDSANQETRDESLRDLLSYLGKQNERIKERVIHKAGWQNGLQTRDWENYSLVHLFEELFKLPQCADKEEAWQAIERAIDTVRAEEYAVEYFRKKELSHSQDAREQKETAGSESTTTKVEDEEEIKPEEKQKRRLQRKIEARARLIAQEIDGVHYGLDAAHLLSLDYQTDTVLAKTTRLSVAMRSFWRSLFDLALLKNNINEKSLIKAFKNQDIAFLDQAYKQLNDSMMETIASTFQLRPGYVEWAWRESFRFLPEMADKIEQNIPSLTLPHQAHELRNEINNTSLPEIVLRAQGKISGKNRDDFQQLKFQALRQQLIFLKTLKDREAYEKIKKKGNVPFGLVMNTFFGDVEKSRTYQLANGQTKNVEIRKKVIETEEASYTLELIIDEKPPKPEYSFWRKSWEAKTEEIMDIFSFNIVIGDVEDNQNSQREISSLERAKLARAVDQELQVFIKEKLGSRYELSLHHETDDSLTQFEKFLLNENSSLQLEKGSRAGSIAMSMPRKKQIIRLKNEKSGEVFTCEFAFYPYASIPLKHQKKGLMGWLEKLADDARYGADRLIRSVKITGVWGLDSHYGLWWPTAGHLEQIETVRCNSNAS